MPTLAFTWSNQPVTSGVFMKRTQCSRVSNTKDGVIHLMSGTHFCMKNASST